MSIVLSKIITIYVQCTYLVHCRYIEICTLYIPNKSNSLRKYSTITKMLLEIKIYIKFIYM